ncbi:MAG: molybdopterin molybdotransferase MoeA [Rhodospirillales bacterium]
MISVAEALENILAGVGLTGVEQVGLDVAHARVLAEDVSARFTQPPVPVSAMDGYAVRSADIAVVPATLRRIGESAAGGSFDGVVGPGECVRIFTGAPVPDGADAILIQEDTEVDGETVTARESVRTGQFVRPAGLDFSVGETLLRAGRILTARDIGLAAAMNRPSLSVRMRPRIAILSTGDELVNPGEQPGPNQIVSSNGVALAAMVRCLGGDPVNVGIAADNDAALDKAADAARHADMLVTIGGASVGDYDLVRSGLERRDLELDFYKIAMRPGKPLMFGHIAGTPMMGLPGNPVSALVCSLIFLRPALQKMMGCAEELGESVMPLAAPLPENDRREDYLRAVIERGPDGESRVRSFEKQDSSMLSRLALADALVVRPPFAKAAAAGEFVRVLHLQATAFRI